MMMSMLDKKSKEKCTFCDKNKADAVWNLEIFLCKRCAIDIIPQFMADAIVGRTYEHIIKEPKPTRTITHEEHILKRFYSAFTCALIYKFRDEKGNQQIKRMQKTSAIEV